jgi:hypothetical protein
VEEDITTITNEENMLKGGAKQSGKEFPLKTVKSLKLLGEHICPFDRKTNISHFEIFLHNERTSSLHMILIHLYVNLILINYIKK